MKPLSFAVALAGLVLAAGPAVRADDAVGLRWKFRNGQVYKFLLKHHEARVVELNNQKFEADSKTDFDWQWKVEDVKADGTASVEMKLTGLRLDCKAGHLDFQYDSSRTNESADEYRKNLIKLLDQLRFTTFRVQVRPDGRIREVQGFDKLLEEADLEKNVVDFHALFLHDDSFRWMLQQVLGVLPEDKVAAGARWQPEVMSQLAGLGALSGRSEYTLGKPVQEGGKTLQAVKLEGKHTLDLDMTWIGAPLRGPVKTDKLTATTLFDAEAGVVRTAEAKVEMGGEVKSLLNADNPLTLKVQFRHDLKLEMQP